MGVNITTIDYLRVLIIEIGSTIILVVVEAQGIRLFTRLITRWNQRSARGQRIVGSVEMIGTPSKISSRRMVIVKTNGQHPTRRAPPPPSYKVVITPANPMKDHGCKIGITRDTSTKSGLRGPHLVWGNWFSPELQVWFGKRWCQGGHLPDNNKMTVEKATIWKMYFLWTLKCDVQVSRIYF